MRLVAKAVAMCAAVAALGSMAWGQAGMKPGLYEVTTSMTWQQSPFPQGMQLPPQAAAAFGGGTHTSQMCMTQEMVDKIGAPIPQQNPRQSCQISNVQKSATGMTADWICTGMMSGKGLIESHLSLDGTITSKMHFTGAMQMGQNPMPMEWTSTSSSVYKGPDCGSVKPPQMPKQQ